jgi:hypothetical protein
LTVESAGIDLTKPWKMELEQEVEKLEPEKLELQRLASWPGCQKFYLTQNNLHKIARKQSK